MRVPVAAVAVLLTTALLAGCADEDDAGAASPLDGREPAVPSVTVVGRGSAEATPDVLHADVGVEVEAPDVAQAYEAAGSAVEQVVAELRELGVAAEDVRTTGLSVQQAGREPSPEGPDPTEDGYVVRSSLAVVVRDVEAAGQVLAGVVAAGGDAARVQGLQLVVEDDTVPREQARRDAVADAREQAEQYAALVGDELGEVLSLREGPATPAPRPGAALDQAAVPVQPGRSTVTTEVEATWELD